MPLLSISRIITRLAEQAPDRPAVSFQGNTITREELDAHTNRLARAYQQLGVNENDLVTLGLPNGIEFIEAAIAIWKLGAIPQPVSYRLPPKELRDIVTLATPPIVIGFTPGMLPAQIVVPSGFTPDQALSDGILPDKTSKHSHACTSGGSTGKPKLMQMRCTM